MDLVALHRVGATLVKARREVDATASPQHAAWADELDSAIRTINEQMTAIALVHSTATSALRCLDSIHATHSSHWHKDESAWVSSVSRQLRVTLSGDGRL